MIVYRICKVKFRDDLSGKGAEISGGRWNSKGVPVIYTASSRALATAEVAVHLPLGIIPRDYCLVEIEFPNKGAIAEIKLEELSSGWNAYPHPDFTQKAGDAILLQNKNLAVKVPSAVVPGDYNILLNPKHPLMEKVKVIGSEKYEFDSRLFVR